MRRHSIITMPLFLKLLAVKIFPKATHHEKKATLGVGSWLSVFFSKGNLSQPSSKVYNSSSPGNLGSSNESTPTYLTPHTWYFLGKDPPIAVLHIPFPNPERHKWTPMSKRSVQTWSLHNLLLNPYYILLLKQVGILILEWRHAKTKL